MYERLNGNAQIIVRKIPHTVSECSNAYNNIPVNVVIINTPLPRKEIIFFLKKVSSVIAGSRIVENANMNKVNQLSHLNPIAPVSNSENALSNTDVITKDAIKSKDVNTTDFQKPFPLFKLLNHSLNEKSFLAIKTISKNK